jgi:dCMP deaminase
MGRISREQMFMDMARAASRRSTCFRLNVGAIVTQGNNPIAVGYNGHEPGAPHCSGNSCPGVVPGKCGTRHAEVNALEKAKTLLLSRHRKPVDLYCTDSPCSACVDYIIRERDKGMTGIQVDRIFYETPYRDTSHLSRLHGVIEVYLVTPAGYVVDNFSRRVMELP